MPDSVGTKGNLLLVTLEQYELLLLALLLSYNAPQYQSN
jgi:hypothetical protein